MRMRIKIILLTILIISCMTNCSKKNERTHYTINDSIKPYCVFQKGSYWVYKLPYSNSTDTTKVYRVDSYTANSNPNYDEGPLNDVISISIYSKIFREFSLDHDGQMIFDQFGNLGISILTPMSVGQRYITTSQDICEYLEFLDTLSCNGNLFQDVIHTRYSVYTGSNDTLRFEYYIGKGTGLVIYKKYFNGIDSTWSLIQFHTNQ